VSASPLVIRNAGETTIRTRTYGQPEYRLIARFDDGDQWLALPKDLRPGDTAEIPLRVTGEVVRLYHALQDVPMLDGDPWETARVR
jgi:hypothetical protein